MTQPASAGYTLKSVAQNWLLPLFVLAVFACVTMPAAEMFGGTWPAFARGYWTAVFIGWIAWRVEQEMKS